MAQSILNNIPWGAISLVLIVLGTIAGGYSSYKDNNTITGLLEQNKEWSKAMDNKIEENSKLTEEIKSISDSIELVSIENKQILKENIQINKNIGNIVKDIKDISKRTEEISKKTGELTENINENSEALKFFNSNNYSYLEKYFPIGYRVIRQNETGRDFIKTYGKVLEYDYFEIHLRELGNNELRYVIKNNRFLENNRVVNEAGESGKIEGTIDANNYTTRWILLEFEFLKDHYLCLLLIDGGYEFTYAVGQVPISELFPEK